jgi:hypothetical protein
MTPQKMDDSRQPLDAINFFFYHKYIFNEHQYRIATLFIIQEKGKQFSFVPNQLCCYIQQ